MVNVRFWQPSDLPDLERMMALLACSIAPADERQAVGLATIARTGVTNLRRVLQTPGGTAAVAEANGRPVGFLLVCLQQDDRTGELLGYLADIYLEPAFRGKGLGQRLERLACDHLRRLGIRRATVWTHAHNALGQKAARRYGLQLSGVVLSKRLQSGTH